jgi:hypothetical protein
MNTEKTGGAAFPRTKGIQDYANQSPMDDELGMTLLDYFAAKAMQGEISNENAGDGIPQKELGKLQLATQCYQMAAAMIEERKKYINQ